MNTHSSGYYSIDKDYNILSYNDTAKQLYPNLQPGVKCYKALMGLDSPCPPCPVALGIYEHPFVYGSPLHLRRAMMNIYNNCIKYNRENGAIHTEVNALPSHDHKLVCRWTISDTGIGISREYLEKIFEPFTQENVDARSVYHGTGLGMSIAKPLDVERMIHTIALYL